MPLCQGRPNGSSPDKRNDSKGTQGDLMLCPACDAFRFASVNHAASESGFVISETTPQSENKLCKDAIKPSTAESERNDVLCFVRNKYGNQPPSSRHKGDIARLFP